MRCGSASRIIGVPCLKAMGFLAPGLSCEAIIHLLISGPGGQEKEIEAVIDTGFTGFLTLPPSLITRLGLPFRRRGRAVLADGRESLFEIYEATVLWDGQPRRVAVDAVNTDSLVGMTLLYGYELTVQAVADKTIGRNQAWDSVHSTQQDEH